MRDQFVYTLTRHGDGTVPTASATLAGARAAYARVAHSELTRDPLVAAAVVDLLATGRTERLAPRLRSASRACVRIGDRELQRSARREGGLGGADARAAAALPAESQRASAPEAARTRSATRTARGRG